jgi:hypothetical protein
MPTPKPTSSKGMRLSKNVMLKLYDNFHWLASLAGFIGSCHAEVKLF